MNEYMMLAYIYTFKPHSYVHAIEKSNHKLSILVLCKE